MVLSAADTELACLAAARPGSGRTFPSLRLANLLQLGHPLSVDLYVEQVVGAGLVVVRLLGGRSYWPYGLEQVAAACRAGGIALAVLPGDDQPDPELPAGRTLPAGDLSSALAVPGPRRSRQRRPVPRLRRRADGERGALAGAGAAAARRPVLAGPGAPDLAAVQRHWQPDRAVAALVFYRALVQAATWRSIDALIEALGDAGLNALPIFTASLKDPIGAPLVRDLLRAPRPRWS